jgi:hypothetical protein
MDKVLLESLFWLLLFSAINSNETSFWNYNILNSRKLISFETQNIYELISELSIGIYALYILFFISKSRTPIISIILFIMGLIYFTDSLSSLLILIDKKNPYYVMLYNSMFTMEFFLETAEGYIALFLIYYLIFL